MIYEKKPYVTCDDLSQTLELNSGTWRHFHEGGRILMPLEDLEEQEILYKTRITEVPSATDNVFKKLNLGYINRLLEYPLKCAPAAPTHAHFSGYFNM